MRLIAVVQLETPMVAPVAAGQRGPGVRAPGRAQRRAPQRARARRAHDHLHVEAIQARAAALREYDGTLLFVSHDRWFVSELAMRIIELTPTGPRDYPGTFAEYLAQSGDDHLDAEAVVLTVPKPAKTRSPEKAQSWEEQKRERNRRAALPGRRDKILAAIEAAEGRKAAIAALFDDPDHYQREGQAAVDALVAESAALDTQIEQLIADWEQIEAELAG